MLSKKAQEAYKDWKRTGVLTNNKNIVHELHTVFSNIEENAIGIPQYELMFVDALHERYKLENIINSRYHKE